MHIYTVQVRPGAPADEPDVVLIREGFCWPAFFVAPLWAIGRRLWLGLVVYVVAALAVGFVCAGVGGLRGLAVWLGFAVLVAAHANDWRRWTLARRGYRFAGVVAAPGLAAAERRLFDQWPPPMLHLATP